MVGNVCDQIPNFWLNFPSFYCKAYVQEKEKKKKRGHLVFFFVLNKKAFGKIKGDRKLALDRV